MGGPGPLGAVLPWNIYIYIYIYYNEKGFLVEGQLHLVQNRHHVY